MWGDLYKWGNFLTSLLISIQINLHKWGSAIMRGMGVTFRLIIPHDTKINLYMWGI